jgi:hypothetical protein
MGNYSNNNIIFESEERDSNYATYSSGDNRQEFLNVIYAQNDPVVANRRPTEEILTKTVIEKEKTKMVRSFNNPFIVYPLSIKFEKDSINKNRNYLVFIYDSIKNFDVLIKGKSNSINFIVNNLEMGKEKEFFNKTCCIDLMEHKPGDLIIELISYKNNKEVECILAISCRIIQTDAEFSIKYEKTKLRIKSRWYSIHNIYGYDTTNECGICTIKTINTIFLPCKHTYICSTCHKECGSQLSKCPLCRKPITDCLIVEIHK